MAICVGERMKTISILNKILFFIIALLFVSFMAIAMLYLTDIIYIEMNVFGYIGVAFMIIGFIWVMTSHMEL